MENNKNFRTSIDKAMVIKKFVLITIVLCFIIFLLIFFITNVIFKKQLTQIKNISSVLVSRVSNIRIENVEPKAIDVNSDLVDVQFEDYFSMDSSDPKPSGIINYQKIKVTDYPIFGSKYGDISIPSVGIELPFYYGDSLQVLKNGCIGHNSGSYFPGEGASIIACGHNTARVLKKISNIKIGDTATIKTTYGEYEYKVFKIKIIEETQLEELPIQKNLEILMIYTCYPFNSIGHVTQRFAVYFERVK